MLVPVQFLPYVDPLIPLNENIPTKLARLSLNITTLTSLIEGAERRRLGYLTAMFTRSRQGKVDQAFACMGTSNHEA